LRSLLARLAHGPTERVRTEREIIRPCEHLRVRIERASSGRDERVAVFGWPLSGFGKCLFERCAFA
jgi:hypothetical protein